MATANSTTNHDGFFEYCEYIWGDLIYGTKEVLQSLGIGVEVAFPGELGGPRKKLNTVDPRGFKCKVEQSGYKGPGIFSASIRFPGRERRPYGLSDWEHFASGVQRKTMYRTDDFVGTAADLVAAGLVPAGYFPGLPGMRKTRVTIFPDGSLPTGAPTANYGSDTRGPGTKYISKASSDKYCVEIVIPEELEKLRREAGDRASAEWEARMRALPRPARLDASIRSAKDEAARERRSAIRLVRPESSKSTDESCSQKDSAPLEKENGRYYYPKSMLRQAYFCRNSYGDWLKPRLSLSVLSHPKFVSPIGLLLDQLEAEGHDVSGARIEWRAFRESSATLSERVRGAFGQFLGISDHTPPLTTALYDKPL